MLKIFITFLLAKSLRAASSSHASSSKAHAELCKEWRQYQSASTLQALNSAVRDIKTSKPRSDKHARPLRHTMSCPADMMADYMTDWPFDAQEQQEARRREADDPLSILRQPLYYREQKRHFDLRDGPFVRASGEYNINTDPTAMAAMGKYITPHGTVLQSAGWYLTAPQEDRRKVIHRMRKLWNFPDTPIGLLHTAMQAIVSITPEYAKYLLDPQAEKDLPLQMHIAKMTLPRLTDASEVEQAALIKEQLMAKSKMSSDTADELILMALKYEGMKDAPTEIVVQHIKNKVEDPKQFASDQFALHRRRHQM